MRFKNYMENQGSPRVSYSAVVLTDESHEALTGQFSPKHPELFAHHMTIKMGPLEGSDRDFIGQTVRLKVVSYAVDDKVEAVGVRQIDNQPKSHNKTPHITISVNREAGGKPFHSNKLKEWNGVDNVFDIEGVVTEVTV
jgi:hypothetical protein